MPSRVEDRDAEAVRPRSPLGRSSGRSDRVRGADLGVSRGRVRCMWPGCAAVQGGPGPGVRVGVADQKPRPSSGTRQGCRRRCRHTAGINRPFSGEHAPVLITPLACSYATPWSGGSELWRCSAHGRSVWRPAIRRQPGLDASSCGRPVRSPGYILPSGSLSRSTFVSGSGRHLLGRGNLPVEA